MHTKLGGLWWLEVDLRIKCVKDCPHSFTLHTKRCIHANNQVLNGSLAQSLIANLVKPWSQGGEWYLMPPTILKGDPVLKVNEDKIWPCFSEYEITFNRWETDGKILGNHVFRDLDSISWPWFWESPARKVILLGGACHRSIWEYPQGP